MHEEIRLRFEATADKSKGTKEAPRTDPRPCIPEIQYFVIADGVRVRVVRANISEVRVKSEPVKESQAANKP